MSCGEAGAKELPDDGLIPCGLGTGFQPVPGPDGKHIELEDYSTQPVLLEEVKAQH